MISIKQNKEQDTQIDLQSALSNYQKEEADSEKFERVIRPDAINLTADLKITQGMNIVRFLKPDEEQSNSIREAISKSETDLFFYFKDNSISNKPIKSQSGFNLAGTEDGILYYIPYSRTEGPTFWLESN